VAGVIPSQVNREWPIVPRRPPASPCPLVRCWCGLGSGPLPLGALRPAARAGALPARRRGPCPRRSLRAMARGAGLVVRGFGPGAAIPVLSVGRHTCLRLMPCFTDRGDTALRRDPDTAASGMCASIGLGLRGSTKARDVAHGLRSACLGKGSRLHMPHPLPPHGAESCDRPSPFGTLARNGSTRGSATTGSPGPCGAACRVAGPPRQPRLILTWTGDPLNRNRKHVGHSLANGGCQARRLPSCGRIGLAQGAN
jgi:hypothetical protein